MDKSLKRSQDRGDNMTEPIPGWMIVDDFVEKIKLLHEREKMTMDARIAELLTACKRLVELMDAHGWGEGPARRAAIEAIKKAEVQP